MLSKVLQDCSEGIHGLLVAGLGSWAGSRSSELRAHLLVGLLGLPVRLPSFCQGLSVLVVVVLAA